MAPDAFQPQHDLQAEFSNVGTKKPPPGDQESTAVLFL